MKGMNKISKNLFWANRRGIDIWLKKWREGRFVTKTRTYGSESATGLVNNFESKIVSFICIFIY